MVLHLFPAQALDSSVITTVWVGLCVIAFLNLRFGLTMAGLVVPGYLVPLLLVKPISFVVVLVEAIVTYLLARLLADVLMRATGSCTMFGRDRFFALLLISVFVRAVSDGWLLPMLGEWLSGQGFAFDYQNNLYSFGLVIIALTANQFWSSRLVRGLGGFAVYVGLTWLLVRWVLIPFTNFDVSSLGFLYETLATDILASPKAYLILLTTAFLASRMNLLYGWEFSGILVPALLALQWFQPGKLLISLVETVIIFALGHLVLRMPLFRRMNMEGARLLLLFFTVGYIYKLLLGHALLWLAPGVKASDFFAFGYLISTLLAVKMHQRQLTWQLARTTMQTSLTGVAVASVVGYVLVLAMPGNPAAAAAAAVRAGPPTADARPEVTLVDALVARKRGLYAAEESTALLAYAPSDLEAFERGSRAALRYRDDRDPKWLDRARHELDRGGFVLERQHGWLLIADQVPERGSGLYGINLAPKTTLAVQVPMPLDEPGVFEAGAQLAESDAHAVFAAAGSRSRRLPEQRSNALMNPGLPFGRFHRLVAAGGTLQVRGMNTEPGTDPPSELWVQRRVPDGVSLGQVSQRVGHLQLRWGRRPAANALRDSTSAPFAELLLSRPSRLRLIARTIAPLTFQRVGQGQRIEGFLHAWLIERRNAISPAGSGRYQPPQLGDLLFLQAEILDPLYRVAAQWGRQRDEAQLQAINAAAASIGYEVLLHRHLRTGEEHAILTEQPGSQTRHWGTVVVRMGEANPYLVEIPRPLVETSSFEYGTQLARRLKARALIISGAHFAVHADGSGNVLDPKNPRTAYNLAHQIFTQAIGQRAWVLQVRGRRDQAGAAAAIDVVASFGGRPAAAADRDRVQRLLATLQEDGKRAAVAGSSAAARVYGAHDDAQSEFTRQLDGPRSLTLWVAASARRDYRSALLSDPDKDRFEALDIPTETLDVQARLLQARFGPGLDRVARARVDDYVRTRNITALHGAIATPGLHATRLLDLDSGRAYLELRGAGEVVVGVRKLDALSQGERQVSANSPPRLRAEFMFDAHAWLLGAP